MKNILLRPHHVDEIFIHRTMDSATRDATVELMRHLYGDNGFNTRYRKFIDRVSDDTSVIITLENDIICDYLGCSFSSLCSEGNYDQVTETLIERMPGPKDPELIAALRVLNPSIGDRHMMRKYGLVVGQTYRFGDIRIVDPNPPLADLLPEGHQFDVE